MQRFTIKKGATSQIITVSIYDSSSTTGAKLAGLVYNTASLTAYYNRVGAAGAATAITMVTATKGTWVSSGFVAVDGTNMPGDYELHLPDAAVASGADRVIIQLKGAANMVPVNIEIDLVAVDLQDAVRAGLTALPNAAADAAGGLPISDAGGLDIDAKLANTNEITAARMGALTDWIDGGRLDLLLDAIKAVTDLLPDAGALTTLITHLTDIKGGTFSGATDSLEAIRNRGDVAWLTGNTVAPNNAGIALIQAVTDQFAFTVANQVDSNVITKTGFSISATGLDLVLYNSTFALAIARAIWTDTLTAYTDGMAGKRLRGLSIVPIVEGVVVSATDAATFITDLTGYDDNHFRDEGIVVETGNGTDAWQVKPVLSYNGTTGEFVIDEDLTFTPVANARVILQAEHVHPITQIQTGLGTLANQATIISTLGVAGAGLTGLGGMSTGMKAEILAEVVKLLTTQMTESYAADGVAPTLTQALLLVQQILTQFDIAGTTLTPKKLDKTTAIGTFTLTDATNPTGLSRTT